ACVATPCGQALAVRAEGHAPDIADQSVQRMNLFAGRRVPDLQSSDRLVEAHGLVAGCRARGASEETSVNPTYPNRLFSGVTTARYGLSLSLRDGQVPKRDAWSAVPRVRRR